MRTATILMAATTAVALLAGCAGLADADDPIVMPGSGTTVPGATAQPSPTTKPSPTEDPSATAEVSPAADPSPTTDVTPTTGPSTTTEPGPTTNPGNAAPAPGNGSSLPDHYPWEPRQSPPPQVDGDDGGEPWIGGFDTVTRPEHVEVRHDGEPTYSVTGIEIYEEGPDQSRAVISYVGGEGQAGLNLSVAGVTDFPPEVTLPGGVDTGMAFLTGAHAPLSGGLESGHLVTPEHASRIHGVSVGPPDPVMGTGIYVGMDAGAVLWAVVDHPGILVLIVTEPGTGPTA